MTDRASDILRFAYETHAGRLYPPPPSHDLQWSDNPQWCVVASRLLVAGETYLRLLAQNPTTETIAAVREQLHERYWRLYYRTTDEHRKDASSALHPCLHRALLELLEKLEDIETATFITQFQPPLGDTESMLMEGEVGPEALTEPPLKDVRDVLFGHEKDPEPVKDESDDDTEA